MPRAANKPSTTILPIQNNKEFTPLEALHVSTLEQLKTISDPLRLEILEAVAGRAYTVKQVADLLNKPPTKLYYHMAALEAAGFVVVVETRIKSGILEKYYRAAAESIDVDRNLLNTSSRGDDETFSILRSSILDSTVKDLKQSHTAGLIKKPGRNASNEMILSRSLLCLNKNEAAEFVKKFRALVKEFDKPRKNAELNYVCTIAFFPRVKKRKPVRRSKS